MVRTQIYIDERQKKELDRLSADRRVTVSELIRQAIDQFLRSSQSGLDTALEKSFGIWKGRDDIGEAPAYVRKIRREWERWEKRL